MGHLPSAGTIGHPSMDHGRSHLILSQAKASSTTARRTTAFLGQFLITSRPAMLCLLTHLLTLLLVACQAPIVTPEPVTILYAFPQNVLDPGYYETLVEEFNSEHTHINVEIRPSIWEDADVLLIPEWQLGQLSQNRQILSLDAIVEQDASFDASDFYPQMLDHMMIEGQIMGIPAGVNMGVMFYNKDLFDAYQVPYPQVGWTWGDFLDSALAIRDPVADVFGYAPWSGDDDGGFDPVIFIYQHGGRIVDDWQTPTLTTFDDPLTIEALEWYASLFLEHDVAPTPEQVQRAFMGTVEVGIVSGKVGMWIDSLSNQGGDELTQWNFRWGAAPLPQDAISANPGWVYGYVISAQTQHPQESWLWIDFLSRQPASRLAPPRRSVVESAAYEELMGDSVDTVDASLQNMMMVPYWTLFSQFGAEMQRFQNSIRQIVSGDVTPEEVMVQIQQ